MLCEAYILRYNMGDQVKVGEKDETGCTNCRSGTGCQFSFDYDTIHSGFIGMYHFIKKTNSGRFPTVSVPDLSSLSLLYDSQASVSHKHIAMLYRL
jgi:hypothetical protein